MDVILISFAICILGVMVTVLLFAVAMRPDEQEDESTSRREPQKPYGRFFLEESPESNSDPQAPNNAILLDLERHVRTEHEAAEAFLRGPSADLLHAPSDSPLQH
ncbi:MAG: hypothetical protein HKO65_19590 [Gemmatimonadetes bacterium]|nr:hypothetical protein [Gemmatimonadota bacterium]NNM07306.1 hypothetical protein [Gemmatimonadota bacterium]